MRVISILVMLMLSFSTFAKNSKNDTSAVETAEIVLTEDNLVVLRGPFTTQSVGAVIERARELDSKLKSGYPIYLFLYTPGGSIQAGLEMYEALKNLNRPVHTITMFAASMGFQTVQQLGNRYIMRYGVLMSHKASGGFDGDFGGGPSQLDSRYGIWLRRIDLLDKDTVARTKGKQTLESYRASYANELWLNGPEAVEQGYADAIANVKCDGSLSGSTQIESNGLFFSVIIELSKCPINNSAKRVGATVETNRGKMSLDEFVTQGGKFGRDCRRGKDVNVSYDNTVFEIKPELCTIDPEITIESIKEAMRRRSENLEKELSQIIKSY